MYGATLPGKIHKILYSVTPATSVAGSLHCRGSEFKKRAGEIYHARGRIFLLDEATVMARKKGITGNMEPTDYLSGLSTACVAIHKAPAAAAPTD